MIKAELRDKSRQKYGRFFLAYEAPGDQPSPRDNMRVVSASPRNRARLDFTNDLVADLPEVDPPAPTDNLPMVADEEPTDNLPEVDALPEDGGDAGLQDIELPNVEPAQTPETDMGNIELPAVEPPAPTDDLPDVEVDLPEVQPVSPTDDLPEVADTAPTDGLPEVDPVGPTDGLPAVEPVSPTDNLPDVDPYTVQVNGGADGTDYTEPAPTDYTDTGTPPEMNDGGETDYTNTGDAGGGEVPPPPDMDAPPDTGGDNGVVPEMDPPPDTDYTDTGGGDQTQQPQQGTNQQQDQGRGPGLEYDSMRKYNLYKEFMKLRTSIDTYITKLDACISDDPESNQIIKIASSKFHDLYDLITDYMTMKYEICTYIQNLLFYQRVVASVHLVFKLLKTSNELVSGNEKKGKRVKK